MGGEENVKHLEDCSVAKLVNSSRFNFPIIHNFIKTHLNSSFYLCVLLELVLEIVDCFCLFAYKSEIT